MKTLSQRALSLLPAALLVLPAVGQRTYDQEEMTANYEAMLTHDWYTGGAWTTDFAAAKAKASETGLPILAYFTRTYAP